MFTYEMYFDYLSKEKEITEYFFKNSCADIYGDFVSFCKEKKISGYNRTMFGRQIKSYFNLNNKCKQRRSDGKRFYILNDNLSDNNVNTISSSKVQKNALNESGYVYFISDGDYVKIGVATHVNERLRQLQTGNPRKLTLIKVLKSEKPYELENNLHDIFEKYRVNGEWFNILSIM